MAQPTFWHPPDQDWAERDLESLPTDGHRYEIVKGALVVTPPADDNHHELADELRAELRADLPAGWRVIREIGIRLVESNAIPDVTVLRPGAPRGVKWHEAKSVALVVEVESRSSRGTGRFAKPGLYAEAGIESYWRIERTDDGPVAHVYQLADAGHYELFASVGPADSVRVERPFPVDVIPAAWMPRG
ncbi:Uma2 family endonuclease [Plantactinospora sp. GCM10030261]|uniref:Uma2 family endonuclease n=1 Tax=Plantactinospora sp. GCM10030261 TaxID=3273420 RepID=UPI00361ACFCF